MKINITLKQLLFLPLLLLSALFIQAQDFNNIEFIENKGQWDPKIKYQANVDHGAIFIRSGGYTVLQHHPGDYEKLLEWRHGHEKVDDKLVLRSHSFNVDFVGASTSMKVIPDKPLPTYNNYFIGGDASKWAGKCRIFQGITYKDVYPNIDIRYYTNQGSLKYDIIAHPGADVSKIALRYEGVDKIQVKNKELVLSTSLGEFRESYPYSYQAGEKGRKEVQVKYVVDGNIVRFQAKEYDPNATLIIDPFMIFCSFSGSAGDNWGFTATYGPDGSFFGGGIVFAQGFPVIPGAFQETFVGGPAGGGPSNFDIGIIKLTPNGASRVYATYLGGYGEDQPHSLVVDPQGNLIVAGRTNAPTNSSPTGFPIASPVFGPRGGFDIIVTKFSADGSSLIGSTAIGGTSNDGANISPTRNGTNSLQQNYGDDGRSEVILDGAGNIYVASSTQSPDFASQTAGSFQPAFGGGSQDGVVLKFSPDLQTLQFASYLGGDGNDAAYVMALAANGNIYVAGGTESGNFPGNHAGTVQPSSGGGIDGYIAEITSNGATLVRSTYIGTAGIDQVYGIQLDRNGFPYVMGQTTGNWTALNAPWSSANGKIFIAKLEADLSAYVYKTMFGSGDNIPNISPTAFLVDRCENVYVSGWGGRDVSAGYQNLAGTQGLPLTADALDNTTDGNDFYFFVLEKNAVNQLYGSYFGQTGGFADHVDGGTSRFDPNGIIYQALCANCGGGAGATQVPTTPGTWAQTNPSPGCNLQMVKIAFNFAGVGVDVESSINGVIRDTAGCLPLEVVFTDIVRNATEYIWNFGEGPDVGPLPAATGYTQTHTYNNAGLYTVMLVAINPQTCNIRDTSYMQIRVGDLRANLAMDIEKLDPCEQFNYRFHNLSTTDPSRPFTDTSFIWDFGDNSPRVVAGLAPVNHTYPAPGTYIVKLILNDTAYCNNPDSISIPVNVAMNVVAEFSTPPVGCAPYEAVFTNITTAESFEWDFGDPASGADNTSTDSNPTHLYTAPGTYTIRMIAIDPNTCNLRDTATFTITVYETPTANFTISPTVPAENTPTTFTNQSSASATSFKWLFGDGDSLVTTSRAPFDYQYNATGTFNACLIAYNEVGCTDTICLSVTTIVTPALDVPNAFTPNSGDVNSKVYVRGFGISKMKFTIWNRWGQKVFETNSQKNGWDGKVKGVVQPMDVYAYTLDVEFFDGTKATRKGDITLIR